jgi:hypothetical protein
MCRSRVLPISNLCVRRSTPTSFVSTRCAQQFLDVRLHEAEPDISVKFLASFIQNETGTPFDAHLVCALVVRSQIGECCTAVNVLFDGNDIHATGFGYLTLNIPACNVPTIAKERAAERPKYIFEMASAKSGRRYSGVVFPLLDPFHEEMRACRRRGMSLQPNLRVNLYVGKPFGDLPQMQIERVISVSVSPSRCNFLFRIAKNRAKLVAYPYSAAKFFLDGINASL